MARRSGTSSLKTALVVLKLRKKKHGECDNDLWTITQTRTETVVQFAILTTSNDCVLNSRSVRSQCVTPFTVACARVA